MKPSKTLEERVIDLGNEINTVFNVVDELDCEMFDFMKYQNKLQSMSEQEVKILEEEFHKVSQLSSWCLKLLTEESRKEFEIYKKCRYLNALTRVNNRIEELNDGWVPDEVRIETWYPDYWTHWNQWNPCKHQEFMVFSIFKPSHSSDVVMQVIKEHKEDLDIIFNHHK